MTHSRVVQFRNEDLDENQLEYIKVLNSGPRAKDAMSPSGAGNQATMDDQGRLKGMFHLWLLDPKVGIALQSINVALRFESRMPPRALELVTLEVARHYQSNHEWSGHAKRARHLGVTEADLEAIRDGAPAADLTPEEELFRRLAQEILNTRDLSDELFKEASGRLGPEAIFDTVTTIAHYEHTQLSIKIWRMPLAEGAERVFDSEF